MPGGLTRIAAFSWRLVVRRIFAHRLGQVLVPLTRDVPCFAAKALHGTPAFKGYHISPGSFTRFLGCSRYGPPGGRNGGPPRPGRDSPPWDSFKPGDALRRAVIQRGSSGDGGWWRPARRASSRTVRAR